jgi:hypothetical protein
MKFRSHFMRSYTRVEVDFVVESMSRINLIKISRLPNDSPVGHYTLIHHIVDGLIGATLLMTTGDAEAILFPGAFHNSVQIPVSFVA